MHNYSLSTWGFLTSSDHFAAVNFTHAQTILGSKSLTLSLFSLSLSLSLSVPLHLAGSMSSCWLGAGGHSSSLLLLWPGGWRWHWRWRLRSWGGAHCTQQKKYYDNRPVFCKLFCNCGKDTSNFCSASQHFRHWYGVTVYMHMYMHHMLGSDIAITV